MGVYGVIVTYTVVWWLTLFAVLPWGVRTQADEDDIIPGTEHGAPVKPGLKMKLLVTTLISALIWGTVYYAFAKGFLTLNDLPGYKPKDYYSDIMKERAAPLKETTGARF